MDSGRVANQRSRAPWRIVAWLGLAITAWSAYSGTWTDTLGYALATGGMFISARDDFYAKGWTKVAALGLALGAVATWTLW